MRASSTVAVLVLVLLAGLLTAEEDHAPGFQVAERTIVLDGEGPVARIRVGPLRTVDAAGRAYEGPAEVVLRDGSEIPLAAEAALSRNGRSWRYRLRSVGGGTEVDGRFSVRMARGSWTEGGGTEPFDCPRPQIAAGDLDGDGRPDLVVAGWGQVFLFRGDGAGLVPAPAPVAAVRRRAKPALADLDGDGRDDVAIAGDEGLWVAMSATPAGSPWPVLGEPVLDSTETGLRAVAAGDLDGDGRPDLTTLASDSQGFRLSFLLSRMAPGAAAPAFDRSPDRVPGLYSSGLSVGDLTGDGMPDLAIGKDGMFGFEVLLNTAEPGAAEAEFGVPAFFRFRRPRGTDRQVEADFDGDGRLDLAFHRTFSVLVVPNRTAPGSGEPAFGEGIEFDVLRGGEDLVVADVNRDGRPDLVTLSDRLEVRLGVHLNRTSPGAAEPRFGRPLRMKPLTEREEHADASSLTAADVTGDGWPDLVAGIHLLHPGTTETPGGVILLRHADFRIRGFRLRLREPGGGKVRLGRDALPRFVN